LETMTILANMNADIDLLIAGVLHDTVEDTDTSLDEIKNTFGEEVANLVAGHSEDKSNTWEERKEKQYHDACKANLRQKKLILADKLANLRSIHKDYKIIGEQLWDRFNEGAIKQCWYYGKMIDALYDLQYYSETEYYYWEMLGVYKDVFVVFALYEKENIIYQENIAGEKYMFMNNNPDWLICDTPTPENAIRIERKYAERLEDNWREQFYTSIDRDILDGSYSLYSSETGGLTISIKEGELALSGSNYGDRCEVVNGKDEYEFYYTLNPGDTNALMVFLRNKYGTQKKLATILKNELGYDDGSARFEELCRNIGVTYKFFSI